MEICSKYLLPFLNWELSCHQQAQHPLDFLQFFFEEPITNDIIMNKIEHWIGDIIIRSLDDEWVKVIKSSIRLDDGVCIDVDGFNS